MTAICLSDSIKALLTMDQVARHYGFTPSRAGYICCPFHKEKTPSLKLYRGSGGFHCFGCGAHGSVIDFVMKLFDITFQQAIIRISSDFGLGLTAERPTKWEASASWRNGGRAGGRAGGKGTAGRTCKRASVLVGGAEVF